MTQRYSKNGIPLEGFAPERIELATVLNTEGIAAIRLSASVSYTINGVGTSAILPAGVTYIPRSTTSLVFAVATTVEIMGT